MSACKSYRLATNSYHQLIYGALFQSLCVNNILHELGCVYSVCVCVCFVLISKSSIFNSDCEWLIQFLNLLQTDKDLCYLWKRTVKIDLIFSLHVIFSKCTCKLNITKVSLWSANFNTQLEIISCYNQQNHLNANSDTHAIIVGTIADLHFTGACSARCSEIFGKWIIFKTSRYGHLSNQYHQNLQICIFFASDAGKNVYVNYYFIKCGNNILLFPRMSLINWAPKPHRFFAHHLKNKAIIAIMF